MKNFKNIYINGCSFTASDYGSNSPNYHTEKLLEVE